jgi:hypothetical protein
VVPLVAATDGLDGGGTADSPVIVIVRANGFSGLLTRTGRTLELFS